MVEAAPDTAAFPGYSRTEKQGLYVGELNKPWSRGLGRDPLGLKPMSTRVNSILFVTVAQHLEHTRHIGQAHMLLTESVY